MNKNINCGRFWTLASVECYLQGRCTSKCRYYDICKRESKYKVPFTMKRVIKMLEQKVGEPPEYLLNQVLSGDLYI